MGWTCAEEREWIYGVNGFEYGVARQEEKRKTIERDQGCSEGRNARYRVRWREMIYRGHP